MNVQELKNQLAKLTNSNVDSIVVNDAKELKRLIGIMVTKNNARRYVSTFESKHGTDDASLISF